MVITIIGMLVALVSVAAMKAIHTANNAKVLVEVGLLDSAMQTYKNDSGGAFPPDGTLLSTPATGTPTPQDIINRQNRILAHVRKAFPRLIVPGGYVGNGTSSSPQQGSLQWMSQQAYAQSSLYGSTLFSSPTPCGAAWGNFDNMDPGEAMVFWLGGFALPVPGSSGTFSYKLIGFSANKVGNATSPGPNANGPNSGFGPFNLDVSSRDAGPFQFDVSRLGDADGDGWPEYYPPIGNIPQYNGTVANPGPPYVYFDAISYGSQTTVAVDSSATPPWPVYAMSAMYPSSSGSGVQPSVYAAAPGTNQGGQWGLAMPYAQTVTLNGNNPATVTWNNPQKFQIICAGQDYQYWFDPSYTLNNWWLRVFPAGTKYSQGDLDNLTNFASSELQNGQ